MRLMQELRTASHEFADFLVERRDSCGGQDLGWMLRMPLQRIGQYTRLFSLLSECSTADADTMENIAVTNLANQMSEFTFSIESILSQEEAGPLERSLGARNSAINSHQHYEGWNVLLVGEDRQSDKNRLCHWLASPEQQQQLNKDVATTGVPAYRNYVISQILDPPLVPQSQGARLFVVCFLSLFTECLW